MASLTTGNLIISPYSENVRFSNLSATNATVTNMSATNASFQRFNSSNILIGPYPQNGTFDTINVTNPTIANLNSTIVNSTNINTLNASMNVLNVSNFLITPLNSNPTFTSINTGSGTSTITIGNNTNAILMNGSTTLAKPLILGSAPIANTQLGFTDYVSIGTGFTISNSGVEATFLTTPTLPIGVWLITYQATIYFASTVTISNFTTYLTSSGTTFFNNLAQTGKITSGTEVLTGVNQVALHSGSVCFNLTSSATISLKGVINANLACKASGVDTSSTQQTYITYTRIA
jgi:hypothetical protein